VIITHCCRIKWYCWTCRIVNIWWPCTYKWNKWSIILWCKQWCTSYCNIWNWVEICL